jgi:hypothetical protein
VQEDRVRIPVVRIFKEISQIAGLLGAERLAVIVRLELIEHRELTDLVERDTRQLMWHDRWKEPLFVASHVVKGRDRRVKVPRRYEQPRCHIQAVRDVPGDVPDRRRAEDNLGDPFQDVLHKNIYRLNVCYLAACTTSGGLEDFLGKCQSRNRGGARNQTYFTRGERPKKPAKMGKTVVEHGTQRDQSHA